MSAFKAFGRICGCASDDEANSPDPADVRDVVVALERARVVGVLDVWRAGPGLEWRMSHVQNDMTGKPFRCVLTRPHGVGLRYFGATPDAARAAAAKAIEAGEV